MIKDTESDLIMPATRYMRCPSSRNWTSISDKSTAKISILIRLFSNSAGITLAGRLKPGELRKIDVSLSERAGELRYVSRNCDD